MYHSILFLSKTKNNNRQGKKETKVKSQNWKNVASLGCKQESAFENIKIWRRLCFTSFFHVCSFWLLLKCVLHTHTDREAIKRFLAFFQFYNFLHCVYIHLLLWSCYRNRCFRHLADGKCCLRVGPSRLETKMDVVQRSVFTFFSFQFLVEKERRR